MKLDDIRTILATSRIDDWNMVKGYPTYKDWVSPLTDGEPIEAHHSVAAYKPDVRLTLAWGMQPPDHGNPHQGGWKYWWDAEDDDIYSFLVDVFFCDALIDRHVGAYVDYRYLPYPDPRSLTDFTERDTSMIGWTVTRWEVEFFRLVHSFNHQPQLYDEGLYRANFLIDES